MTYFTVYHKSPTYGTVIIATFAFHSDMIAYLKYCEDTQSKEFFDLLSVSYGNNPSQSAESILHS